MKKTSLFKRLSATVLLAAICLFAFACAPASDAHTQTDPPAKDPQTEPETERETLSFEEMVMMEDFKYLDTVTHKSFELTGEDTPFFVGRWFEKEIDGVPHTVTTTDGSHLYFLVEGASTLSVNFTVITRLEMPYFAYSIDGAEPIRQHIDEPTVALPDEERHTVCIIADGMTESEAKWAGEIGFALRSVETDAGRIAGIRPREKVVFFYGDSITQGVRALNMNATSDGNSATHAYPWYTAQNLEVVPYFIGYGASGLVQTGSFHPMPDAIDYLSQTRQVTDSEIADITPDLIVINHGANDSSLPNASFNGALRVSIERLQEKYPGVKIVYCVAFLEASTQSVKEQGKAIDRLATEVEGLYVIHTENWRLSYTDGNLHPDAAGAEKAGELLAKAIKEAIGADFFEELR